MIDRIHWLGHSSFLFKDVPGEESAPTIYIDPWRIPDNAPLADIILISHDHHDHFSPGDINRICHPQTRIFTNERTASLLGADAEVMRTWQVAMPEPNISIRAVPAYTPDNAYHMRDFGGLGFIVSMLRYDIYFAGDTGFIPEFDKVYCDIALLPVGGMTTMNHEEALLAVKKLKPMYAFPMHYGREVPGSQQAGKRFCQRVLSECENIGSYEFNMVTSFT